MGSFELWVHPENRILVPWIWRGRTRVAHNKFMGSIELTPLKTYGSHVQWVGLLKRRLY